MERHIISIDNFRDPALFERLLASSGGGAKDNKRLYVIVDVKSLKAMFLIKHGTISETIPTLEKAIKRYNELP